LRPSQSTIKNKRLGSKLKTQGELKGVKHILISNGKPLNIMGVIFNFFGINLPFGSWDFLGVQNVP
jgi:hypothetical protein